MRFERDKINNVLKDFGGDRFLNCAVFLYCARLSVLEKMIKSGIKFHGRFRGESLHLKHIQFRANLYILFSVQYEYRAIRLCDAFRR